MEHVVAIRLRCPSLLRLTPPQTPALNLPQAPNLPQALNLPQAPNLLQALNPPLILNFPLCLQRMQLELLGSEGHQGQDLSLRKPLHLLIEKN